MDDGSSDRCVCVCVYWGHLVAFCGLLQMCLHASCEALGAAFLSVMFCDGRDQRCAPLPLRADRRQGAEEEGGWDDTGTKAGNDPWFIKDTAISCMRRTVYYNTDLHSCQSVTFIERLVCSEAPVNLRCSRWLHLEGPHSRFMIL